MVLIQSVDSISFANWALDIIDGFGSYPDHFMSTPVFMGIGGVAFKYYMLFQHQSVPAETAADEPSWLLGAANGPYIKELSRSIFVSLGKHVAFLGLDCRTERRVSRPLALGEVSLTDCSATKSSRKLLMTSCSTDAGVKL